MRWEVDSASKAGHYIGPIHCLQNHLDITSPLADPLLPIMAGSDKMRRQNRGSECRSSTFHGVMNVLISRRKLIQSTPTIWIGRSPVKSDSVAQPDASFTPDSYLCQGEILVFWDRCRESRLVPDHNKLSSKSAVSLIPQWRLEASQHEEKDIHSP